MYDKKALQIHSVFNAFLIQILGRDVTSMEILDPRPRHIMNQAHKWMYVCKNGEFFLHT